MKKLLTNKKVVAAFVGALAAAGVVALIARHKEIAVVIEDMTEVD